VWNKVIVAGIRHRRVKVEPTTHQLVFTDSTPIGKLVLKRSLSV